MNNIEISRAAPRMRTVAQVRREYPDLQLSDRYLRSLVRENKIVAIHIGAKTLINLDSLFGFLNGESGAAK